MIDLPSDLARLPAVIALNRALDSGRMPHGILMAGEDLPTLRTVARALSSRLLETATPESHPDYHELRPANKMRRIGIDDTRDLIRAIQISSYGGRKVGLVMEADRMAGDATNAFLKTLEEPPAGTTLLLLTTKPNAILDTIRSRCLLFKVPPVAETADASTGAVEGWLDRFSLWHAGLRLSPGERPDGARVAEWFIGIYGLMAQFEATLEVASDAAWKNTKTTLPDTLEEEQIDALETGVRKGLRSRYFAGVLERLRRAARNNLNDDTARRLHASSGHVEKYSGLLEVNLADAAAMEALLLNILRIETAAG
jgi:DNA polymerase-3 subunit delta'